MAKRRVIKIDGGSILADTGSSIRTALEQAGIENPMSVVAGGEIITAADFNRPLPDHDMLVNLTAIIELCKSNRYKQINVLSSII
jgi:hypothetical protein